MPNQSLDRTMRSALTFLFQVGCTGRAPHRRSAFGEKHGITLDSSKIPKSCVPLLQLAERWGVEDDFERESAVSNAPREVLQQLVDAIQQMPDDELFEWLAGPESLSAAPSPEYLAFTCLTMAYDSARLKLKR